jgi:hypothetical protein
MTMHSRLRVLSLLLILGGNIPVVCEEPVSQLRFLPPGTADIHHLCLIYHGQERRVDWTAENLLPYVAYVDEEGKPIQWLFDSFLFIEFATNENKSLYHYAPNAAQADGTDWVWLADVWFREKTGLCGLERCVEEAGAVLNDPEHKVNVVITLPMPLHQVTKFNNLPGTSEPFNFSQAEDRQQALEWYINTVSERFAAANYQHLNLLGFYWTGESIVSEQHETVLWTADFLHNRELKFYWIPYFTAAGVEHWREVGFDAMMLQPNYFFEGNGGVNRLMLAAKRALILGSGVEMEFDGRAFTSEEYYQRYWDYLDAGVKYGWMKEALLGWYEGGGALLRMFEEGDKGRAMYDALYHFMKGDYAPENTDRLPELITMPPTEKGENLALASRGAKVHGAIDDGQSGLAPDRMINGQWLMYTGTSGFTWFGIPGSVTVELSETASVNRTRTLFFDLDGRHYTYRIDTSIDGEHWEPAVDKSEGQWSSWQLDSFSERQARFIRITGLSNSTGQNLCQIVEFEVYGNE